MNAARTRATVPRQSRVGSPAGGSTRTSAPSSSLSSPGSAKRGTGSQVSRQGPPSSVRSQANCPAPTSRSRGDEDVGSSQQWLGTTGVSLSGGVNERALSLIDEDRGLFSVIEHLAAEEAALWSILDGLKSNASYVSFFCREYWGTSASQAQLVLEKVAWNERLKRQVQQACVLESLSLGVASHLCSGTMQDITLTILSRLRNLLYYIHENCLVLLDLVCQRWLQENPSGQIRPEKAAHDPENLNLDILIRTGRYRQLRKGEHVMALRQHNEMIANVVRQLCRGGALRRPTVQSSRTRGATSPSPGDRSPGMRSATARSPGGSSNSSKAMQGNILTCASDILAGRTPLERLRASTIRSKMLQHLCFRPMLNIDGSDPDSALPTQDPYNRYGSNLFAQDAAIVWFEPLPPMLCDLKQNPKLPPPCSNEIYTLVLDLDETLVHYFEQNGVGSYGIRPGMHEFLQRMHSVGYELVIFTAATQDYADWVIDQIDPERLVHHRLYRQHALPWGPLFAKDLSRLGRDLSRTLIIDNVQENFMLQPNNGIFISPWYDDPHDTALFTLTPLLEELVAERAIVPEILDKYQDQIPTWAGFDQFSDLGGDYSEYDNGVDDGYDAPQSLAPVTQDARTAQVESNRPSPQPDPRTAQRTEARQPSVMSSYTAPAQSQPPMQHHQPQQETPPSYTGGYATQVQPQALQQRSGYPKASPAFSAVSGPYQAQPPQQQSKVPVTASTQGPRPPNATATATMWARTGLGPHQLVQPQRK